MATGMGFTRKPATCPANPSRGILHRAYVLVPLFQMFTQPQGLPTLRFTATATPAAEKMRETNDENRNIDGSF